MNPHQTFNHWVWIISGSQPMSWVVLRENGVPVQILSSKLSYPQTHPQHANHSSMSCFCWFPRHFKGSSLLSRPERGFHKIKGYFSTTTLPSTCYSSSSKSWLYSPSLPETTAMKEYIPAVPAVGIIQPSSSPVVTGFFFISIKDKSLQPCIDYRGPNDITIKHSYSLQLISSAFQRLQEANVFTALDS